MKLQRSVPPEAADKPVTSPAPSLTLERQRLKDSQLLKPKASTSRDKGSMAASPTLTASQMALVSRSQIRRTRPNIPLNMMMSDEPVKKA